MSDIEPSLFQPSIVYVYPPSVSIPLDNHKSDITKLFENVVQMSNQITSSIVDVANLLSIDLLLVSNTDNINSNSVVSESEHEINVSMQNHANLLSIDLNTDISYSNNEFLESEYGNNGPTQNQESIEKPTPEKSCNANVNHANLLSIDLNTANNNGNNEFLESEDGNNAYMENQEAREKIIEEKSFNTNVNDDIGLRFRNIESLVEENSTNESNKNNEEEYQLSMNNTNQTSILDKENTILNSNSTEMQSSSDNKTAQKEIIKNMDNFMIKDEDNRDDFLEKDYIKNNDKLSAGYYNNIINNEKVTDVEAATKMTEKKIDKSDKNENMEGNTKIKIKKQNCEYLEEYPDLSDIKMKSLRDVAKPIEDEIIYSNPLSEKELNIAPVINMEREQTQSVIFNPASITTKTLKRIIQLKSPGKLKESETEYQGTRIEQRDLLKLLLDLKGAKTKEDWLACRKLIRKSGACWECGKRECWEERKIFNKTLAKDNYTKYVCKGQKIIGAFWNDQLDKPLRVKYVKEKKDKRKRKKKENKPLKSNCNEAKVRLSNIPHFITDSDIIDCFSRFSRILKFDRPRRPRNTCILSLEDFPNVANLLIRRGKCKIQGELIGIKTVQLGCQDTTCCGSDI